MFESLKYPLCFLIGVLIERILLKIYRNGKAIHGHKDPDHGNDDQRSVGG